MNIILLLKDMNIKLIKENINFNNMNKIQAKEIAELKAELEKVITEYDKLYDEKQNSVAELISFANNILEKDSEYTYEGEFCESSDFAFKLDDITSVKKLIELMANEIYQYEKQKRDKQYDELPDYIEKEELKSKIVELENFLHNEKIRADAYMELATELRIANKRMKEALKEITDTDYFIDGMDYIDQCPKIAKKALEGSK